MFNRYYKGAFCKTSFYWLLCYSITFYSQSYALAKASENSLSSPHKSEVWLDYTLKNGKEDRSSKTIAWAGEGQTILASNKNEAKLELYPYPFTGKKVCRIPSPYPLEVVDWHPITQQIIGVNKGKRIFCYDYKRAKTQDVEKRHPIPILSLRLHPKETNLFFSSDRSKELYGWKIEPSTTGKLKLICTYRFTAHNHTVHSFAFSSLVNKLASGGGDNEVKLWDLTTTKVIASFGWRKKHSKGSILGMNWDRKEELLVVGHQTGLVKLLDPRTTGWVCCLAGHQGAVYAVDIAHQLVASGGADQTVKLWDLRYQGITRSACLAGDQGSVDAISFNPVVANTFAAAYRYATKVIWQLQSTSLLEEQYKEVSL